MNPLFSQLLGGSGMQQGTGQSAGMPQPPQIDMGQMLQQMLMQKQQGQTVQSTPWDSRGNVQVGPDGVPIDDGMVLQPKGAIQNSQAGDMQPTPPQGGFESMPIVDAQQTQQMGAGGAPNVGQQFAQQGMGLGGGGQSQQGGGGGGLDWAKLIGGGGNRDNPNALVRMGEGYNSGGLIGALVYLLTDMSQKGGQQQPPTY
jgi:hypothetical protein